jgi:prepilin-type N-terminal cleavage/methylation domain-containing protein
MKIQLYNQDGARIKGLAQGGYTLPELMVSMVLILLVTSAVISTHIFGLRLFEMVKAKLGASDEARAAISAMVAEIRSAKVVRIGTGTLSTFTEVAPNTNQVGNSIQVYSSTNLNSFVRYYWDDADQKLKRTTNGTSFVRIVANSISNQMVFTSEDFKGNLLTNNENNRVIGLTLQFYQLEFPYVKIGPGNYYDFYQLRTKITRRTLE